MRLWCREPADSDSQLVFLLGTGPVPRHVTVSIPHHQGFDEVFNLHLTTLLTASPIVERAPYHPFSNSGRHEPLRLAGRIYNLSRFQFSPAPVESQGELAPFDTQVAITLSMYHAVYELGRAAKDCCQPRPLSVDPEELKAEIRDNRTTELYYPLYEVCPTVDGRQNLLELARETVADRQQEEDIGELAGVLRAVVHAFWFKLSQADVSGEYEIPSALTKALVLESYNQNLETGEEQVTSKWLGWKLRKLQFKGIRLGDRSGTRAISVDPRKLYRLARRFAKPLAATLTETSETTEAEGGSVNSVNSDVLAGNHKGSPSSPANANGDDVGEVSKLPCRACGKTGLALLPDPKDGKYGLCQSCYDKRSAEGS